MPLPTRLLALALAASVTPLGAQQTPPRPRTTPPARHVPRPTPRPALQHPERYDTSAFAALRWREIGPFRGGRSVAAAGSRQRPREYWMGTTGGGVYKTTDGGITWAPVTDKSFGGTIGAIAVAGSNPDIVYVGGGEYPIRGNVAHGDGMWKTTDAGKTWTRAGLESTRHIADVRVHPTNPDIVYAGVLGHVYGATSDRGVFKSTDGGKSWRKVLFVNDSTGVTDLVMDPGNPEVLYAAFWQAGRTPWMLVSGGPHSKLFKTTDGGATWTEFTRARGLPQTGPIGNSGIAVSPANPRRLWLMLEHDSGGVFRSEDAGASWTKINDERKLRQRAWYYSKIYADPKDTNVVYVSNVGFHKSTDGGKSWKAIPTPHSDSHDLWIAPDDPQRMIEANDGGANVSYNGGKSWSEQDFATAQFYHVTTTGDWPYHVCGAQQDNSTLCGPSRKEGGIRMADWYEVAGGESGYIAVKPDDPNITYGGSYGGYLTRKDRRTGLERAINPYPVNPMGHSAGEIKYRFQWTFPIVTSVHDPAVVYAAANVLFRSRDGGESWAEISPDLTLKDPRTLGPSGGPITKDQTSVEYYGTIFTMAESPLSANVLWTGSDDGLVHVSRDGARTWNMVRPPDMPDFTRVSMIEASPHAAGTAWVAANRYQLDDFAPYLWKTTDYGRTWTRIDRGIPGGEFTRVLREDPEVPGLLYVGTERGVHVSFDAGAHWQPLQINLPPVPIHDLVVKSGDLVAATHGRSFWILDDLSSIRQLSKDVVAKDAHLFEPAVAYRTQWGGGRGESVGANPPSGAVVRYWLAKPPSAGTPVTLEFLDGAGKVIRSFTSAQDPATRADSLGRDSTYRLRRDSLSRRGVGADSIATLEKGWWSAPAATADEDRPRVPRPQRATDKQGLNQFTWNLRYPDASSFDGMILWAGGTNGPVAPPGTYSVRLTANGVAQTRPLVVRKDPRSDATLADLREQFALLMKIRDTVTAANDAVKAIRSIRAQVEARRGQLPDASRQALAGVATPLLDTLARIEGEIYQVRNQSSQDPLNYPIRLNNKISALASVVGSTEARPTKPSYAAFAELTAQLQAQLLAMQAAMANGLPRVNALLAEAKLPPIDPKAEMPATMRVAEGEGDEEAEQRRW